jgi:hypothetical protein
MHSQRIWGLGVANLQNLRWTLKVVLVLAVVPKEYNDPRCLVGLGCLSDSGPPLHSGFFPYGNLD